MARHALLQESVSIPIGAKDAVEADLVRPERTQAIVVFAHGSGSSRFSSRNRAVAGHFHEMGLGTMLLDLLTPAEEEVDLVTREYRFDIERLGSRVVAALDWLRERSDLRDGALGIFGASTGAAAALIAAAERPEAVRAVVSRGGRPDLAHSALPSVRAPTLLIVGQRDEDVIDLNREAMRQMKAPLQLEIVPGATHLFEEAGAMETVQRLAGDWFVRHLGEKAPN